jgi:hypothetical protein
MTRELLPYLNSSFDPGIEGLADWANFSMDGWVVPIFLAVFYGLAIHISTKNEYKIGGQIAWISFAFFIIGMIAQTFTQFNQLIMFGFVIGLIVGIVMSYVENARG